MSIPFKKNLKSNIDVLIDDSKQNVIESTRWDNLREKPELFPPKPHRHDVSEIDNLPNLSSGFDQINNQINTALSLKVNRSELKKLAYKNSLSFDEITNKPTSYPPTPHKHGITEIDGLESLRNKFGDYVTKQDLLNGFNQVEGGNEFVRKLVEVIGQISSNNQVGSSWISFDGTIPVGGIPFLGGEYNIEDYPALYQYAKSNNRLISRSKWEELSRKQNGNVSYYCDVGNGKFRVPKITSYFKGAQSENEVGNWISQGLPNITGEVGFGTIWNLNVAVANGAFTKSSHTDRYDGHGQDTVWGSSGWAVFDASRSDKIYGNSNNVTPHTNIVLVGVYAFSKVTNSGDVDISHFVENVTRINEKISKLENDTSKVMITETWHDNNSWFRKYSDGWIEQGGKGREPSGNNVRYTITFPTPFKEPPQTAFTTNSYTSNASYFSVSIVNTSTTQMTCQTAAYGSDTYRWFACGY